MTHYCIHCMWHTRLINTCSNPSFVERSYVTGKREKQDCKVLRTGPTCDGYSPKELKG